MEMSQDSRAFDTVPYWKESQKAIPGLQRNPGTLKMELVWTYKEECQRGALCYSSIAWFHTGKD